MADKAVAVVRKTFVDLPVSFRINMPITGKIIKADGKGNLSGILMACSGNIGRIGRINPQNVNSQFNQITVEVFAGGQTTEPNVQTQRFESEARSAV